MQASRWTSQAHRLTDGTCVDIKADKHGVVLGQLGDVWLHNLHLTPDFADSIGDDLKIGAAKAREAGAQS
ncbi:MAG: hypothetical protein ABIU96_04050 [Rhodanobacter sp.]